jgi:hypothetical protein
MDSYVLSDLMFKLFLVGLGWFLVVRGKGLKEKQITPKSFLSPNALILIGFTIIILNVLQILWLFYVNS